MNKKLLLTLIPVMTLVACNKATYKLELNVASPSGSPAVALYKYLADIDHLEVNSDATAVLAYFTSTETSKKKDVIFAPTNAGISAIVNNNAPYKIAATVTFGNFYLIATGLDSDGTLNDGDKVLAFQQKGVAGKLFDYVYGDKSLDVTYRSTAADVKNEVLTQNIDYGYILLAQPVVGAVISAKEGYKVYANVQKDYKDKTGGKEITQASIFVRNDVDAKVANKFLNNVEKDVKKLLEKPEVFLDAVKDMDETLVTGKVTAKKEGIVNLIKNGNALGIGYKKALDNKTNIDAFVQTLGLSQTNEEIYFNITK